VVGAFKNSRESILSFQKFRHLAYTPPGTVFAGKMASVPANVSGETETMSQSRSHARKAPISRALRNTIRERGLTAYAAAKKAGVSVDAVQRFLNHQRGLTLATVDKLTSALELTLCPEEPSNNADMPTAER
jgi:DNA-binding phage protein